LRALHLNVFEQPDEKCVFHHLFKVSSFWFQVKRMQGVFRRPGVSSILFSIPLIIRFDIFIFFLDIIWLTK